jgi:hypothetical protein
MSYKYFNLYIKIPQSKASDAVEANESKFVP